MDTREILLKGAEEFGIYLIPYEKYKMSDCLYAIIYHDDVQAMLVFADWCRDHVPGCAPDTPHRSNGSQRSKDNHCMRIFRDQESCTKYGNKT